jgi:hypothetical protein
MRRCLPFFCCLLCSLLPASAAAQRQAGEAELKAAIIVNLLSFVDWPPLGTQGGDRLILCHLDDAPVVAALALLEGRPVRNRPLRVQRVDGSELSRCHALYIDADHDPRPLALALQQGGSSVLLIGDAPGHLARGAAINLEADGSRVAFDVDLRAARLLGLAISSKALRLARTVRE